MDIEKKTTDLQNEDSAVPVTEPEAATEPETVTEPDVTTKLDAFTEPEAATTGSKTVEKGKTRSKRKAAPVKTRLWDDLFSALLLILLLGLMGVMFYLLNTHYELGNLSANLTNTLIYLTFFLLGLGLFFATRTGEGKNVYRVNWFSLGLILLPLTAFYVYYFAFYGNAGEANFLKGIVDWVLSFGGWVICSLGLVLLGYTFPYSFISGYERKYADQNLPADRAEAEATESDAPETEEDATESPEMDADSEEGEETAAEADSDTVSEAEVQPTDDSVVLEETVKTGDA